MKKQFEVNFEDTAKYQGSGDNSVLSTPRLVSFMENTAKSMIDGSSVGYIMNIKHIAPTPLGNSVIIDCHLINQEGRKFVFSISAYDSIEKIAEAEHVRYSVDKDSFQEKADKKQDKYII